MKIGPIDIGIPALVNLGGCVVAIIALLAFWNKNSTLRYEAYYGEKILRGLAENLPEKQREGSEACQALLKVEPNSVPVRLSRANIHADQNDAGTAKKEFDAISKMTQATPLEKAIALTGAGVTTFKIAAKEARGPAIDEAEKYFRAAIDADGT